MSSQSNDRFFEILLVEDSPDDVYLTRAAFEEVKLAVNLNIVGNGMEAMEYLHRQGHYAGASRPDLILLDLNLPRKDGREVLAEIRGDEGLTHIPVVILTTSDDDVDILKAYKLHANGYVTKPVGLEQFITIVKSIEDFWLTVVKLPPKGDM